MDIIEGCFYHISDKFFLEVNEPSLMANKEDGNYRPHYLAIRYLEHRNFLDNTSQGGPFNLNELP